MHREVIRIISQFRISIISKSNANILNANQTRLSSGGAIGKQSAEFIIETFDHDHISKIKADMKGSGSMIGYWCKTKG